MILKGSHVKFAPFLMLAITEKANMTFFCSIHPKRNVRLCIENCGCNIRVCIKILEDDIKTIQCMGNLPNEDSQTSNSVIFFLILESLNEI